MINTIISVKTFKLINTIEIILIGTLVIISITDYNPYTQIIINTHILIV